MQTTQIDKVNTYYNSTVIDYKTVWMGSEDQAMHFGYYDERTKSHRDSLLKMNEVLAGLASISKNDLVMDAGCGYGGSAVWLAKNIGCDVIGFTVVPYQVKTAGEFAKKNNLSNKVSFRQEDYAHTSFPDNSFTVVWGLESIVHAESKKDFVREAYRLLKIGGRILISEYMLREDPPLSGKEQLIIDPWLKGWAMPSLSTPNEYKNLLESSGFKNIKIHDLTNNVRQSLRRLEKLSNFGLPFASFLRKLRLINQEHFGNVEASVAQSKALKMGLWKYTVITAEKNSSCQRQIRLWGERFP